MTRRHMLDTRKGDIRQIERQIAAHQDRLNQQTDLIAHTDETIQQAKVRFDVRDELFAVKATG